jgi:hypothetical protein
MYLYILLVSYASLMMIPTCIYIYNPDEMGGACSSVGGGERRVQGFGGETRGKETTGETNM